MIEQLQKEDQMEIEQSANSESVCKICYGDFNEEESEEIEIPNMDGLIRSSMMGIPKTGFEAL